MAQPIYHRVTMELVHVFGWIDQWVNQQQLILHHFSTWPIHHSRSKHGCMHKRFVILIHILIMPFSDSFNKTFWIIHFTLSSEINVSISVSSVMMLPEIRWANNKNTSSISLFFCIVQKHIISMNITFLILFRYSIQVNGIIWYVSREKLISEGHSNFSLILGIYLRLFDIYTICLCQWLFGCVTHLNWTISGNNRVRRQVFTTNLRIFIVFLVHWLSVLMV